MTILEQLTTRLPTGWHITTVDVGNNWVLSQVKHLDGRQQAGVAAAPRQFPDGATFPVGTHHPKADIQTIISNIKSDDPTTAAVALATFNAVHTISEADLTTFDAADWLAEKSKGRNIAIFGRFPFIEDEICPFANHVFVFEQTPSGNEFTAIDMPDILPQADIIAITGSTIINHTIDDILKYTGNEQTVVVLGPSTPLSSSLFDFGIDGLFGVRVADVNAVQASVHSHLGFQKIQGLQRVSLFKT